MFDFDEVIDRTGSLSKRWQGRGDRISLTIGDSDFRLPPAIRQTISTRLDEGVIGYDSVPDSLVELVIQRLESRYNWKIEAEWLVFLPGVVPGLNFSCRGFTGEGDSILTESPVYYPFLEAPGYANRSMIELRPVAGDDRWGFDLDGFEHAVTSKKVPLFLFCNPQNPLGRVSTRDELSELAEVCLKNHVLVCSDEIHCDLLFDGRNHVPLASLSKEVSDNTITLMSPSKAFGVSGIGGAFAVISDEAVREKFEQAAGGVNMGMTALPIVTMQAAYGECQDWLDEELEYLAANRALVAETLGQVRGLDFVQPEGTYFYWLDFSTTGLNDPFESMCEAGVELSDGEPFGDRNFLRLNFASPKDRLQKALDRMVSRLSA